jgi:hypothetical protein
LKLYKRELRGCKPFANGIAFTVQSALTLETPEYFRATWPTFYKSSYSRAVAQSALTIFWLCYPPVGLSESHVDS